MAGKGKRVQQGESWYDLTGITADMTKEERDGFLKDEKDSREAWMRENAIKVRQLFANLQRALNQHSDLMDEDKPNPEEIDRLRLVIEGMADNINARMETMSQIMRFDAYCLAATSSNPATKARYMDAASKIKAEKIVIPAEVKQGRGVRRERSSLA